MSAAGLATMRVLLAVCCVAVWAWGTVVFTAGGAAAHAGIVSTNPANRALLPEPPSELVLRFNEPVGIDLGGVRVIGPGGARIDTGKVGGDADPTRVTVPLEGPETEGTHLVSWRVVSADGHPVVGAFVYSVGAETGTPSAGPEDLTVGQNPTTTVALGLSRFLGFAAMCVLIGSVVFIGWLWPEGADRGFVRTMVGWAWAGAFLSSAATLLLYGPFSAGLGPEAALRLPVLASAVSTPTGEALLVRTGALLLAGILLTLIGIRTARGRLPRRWQAPLLLSALVLALLAWSRAGHAGAAGSWYTVNMAVHFAAAGVWLGGLALLTAGLRPAGDPDADTDAAELAAPLERWSKLTAVSVAVITVTGVLSAVREVEVWDALWSTTYGFLLAFKVALVALMLLLGNAGRLWIRRRSRARAAAVTSDGGEDGEDDQDDQDDEDPVDAARRDVAALRYNTGAEAVIAAMVLVVTTVLVETLPAKDAFAPVYSEVQRVGPVNVQTDFEPARVGPNVIHIYVTDEVGRPVDVAELSGRLRLPEEELGPLPLETRRVAPGHYQVEDLVVPVRGHWTLDLSVRTSDVQENTSRQTIRVR